MPGGSACSAPLEMAARPVMRPSRIDLGHRPFIVIWEATRACDLACVHCRAEAQPLRSARELDTGQARQLLEQVRGFGDPPPFFVITGGDPFKRPDLVDLVEYGAGIGLPMAVSPSGTPLLNEGNLRRLRSAGAHAISLSLDGATAAVHDEFRGVPGSFAWTLRGWQSALDAGLRVQINTTVTPSNLAELPDLLAIIAQRGVLTWSIFFLVPTGRGSRLPQLTPQQAEDVLNFCYDANRIVSVKTTEAPAFRRVSICRRIIEEQELPVVESLHLGPDYRLLRSRMGALGLSQGDRVRRPPTSVNAGRGFVFIAHDGQVYPSGFLPVSAGSVRQTPLADIYRSSDLFRGMRDAGRLHARCGACEFRSVCGGSRPRAYGATGDLYADDPMCGYVPGSFGHAGDVAALLAG